MIEKLGKTYFWVALAPVTLTLGAASTSVDAVVFTTLVVFVGTLHYQSTHFLVSCVPFLLQYIRAVGYLRAPWLSRARLNCLVHANLNRVCRLFSTIQLALRVTDDSHRMGCHT